MSFAPNETASDLWLERVNLDGTSVTAMAYGAYLVVAGIALYLLLGPLPSGQKRSWFSVAYVLAVTTFSSIYFGGELKWTELMFSGERNFPGGPDGFFFSQVNDFPNLFAVCAYVANSFLADGMILYRLLLLWNYKIVILVLSVLWFIASTVMSIIAAMQLANPNASLFASRRTFNFTVPYFSLSLSFTIFATLLIVGRLWYFSRKTRALGTQHTAIYGSVSAMLVESAAIYSINSLIFIILYARGNLVSGVFLGTLSQTQAVAPVLIIARVAYGRGISRATMASAMTSMHWGTNNGTKRTNTTAVSFVHDTVAEHGEAYPMKIQVDSTKSVM